MPKSVPKSIQTCFRVIFSKIFYAPCSMEDRVFENFQIFFFSKFQKCPKSFQKRNQTCFELVLGQFFRNFFLPSVPWRVEFSKIFTKNIFKIPKMPKSVPKSIQTCFSVIFSKKIYAQCSMEGRVFEKFQFFFSKFQKCPKSFQKRNQTCFELVLGQFFRNFFCPVFRGGSSFRKFSQKIFSKFQKCPKVFPKVFKRVLV